MTKTLWIAAALAGTLLANPYESKKEEIADAARIGKKASAELLKTLGGNLKKHLKAGGPAEALDFCANNAYSLTEKVSDTFGKSVSVKRISLRYRNPLNAPADAKEKAVLEALETMNENGVVLPRGIVQDLGNGVYKYYRPLKINKGVCLKCHGDLTKTNPDFARAIRKIYPDDRATGFRMGDLRGAIVVEVHE